MTAVMADKSVQDEQALVDLILGKIQSSGAEAQIAIVWQKSWEAGVAKGSIEQLTNSASAGLSLIVYLPDGRFASVSSNDFRKSSICELADNAIALAGAGVADPCRGLPPLEACGLAGVENLDDKGGRFDADEILQSLLDAEARVLSADPRVIGFDQCSISRSRKRRRIVNSRGLDVMAATTDYRISIEMVAEQNGEKQLGVDFAAAKNLRDLRPASEVASIALAKAVRGFGYRKAKSGPVGVVLDNNVASGLLGSVKLLAAGEHFLSRRSYWADRIDTIVAAPCMTIIDDPLIPGGVGSREFDGSGGRAGPLTIVERGTLRSCMTDAYVARKLNRPFTGHADGASNLIVQAGTSSQEELLAGLGRGFYVTGIQGHGVDITAGTWSKGASGFWIENGKIVHPIQGVTLAGKLDDIFQGIAAVGDDPKGDTDTSSPSLLIPRGIILGGE